MAQRDEVSIGEVYRRLVDLDERWTSKLDSIDTQVRTTNGRTTRLEERVTGHDREIGELRRRPVTPTVASLLPTEDDDKPALTRRDLRMLLAALTALQMLAGGILWAIYMFERGH